MTAERSLGSLLSSYFEDLAAPPAPHGLLERVIEATADRTPRPRWRAAIRNGTEFRVAGRPMSVVQLGRVIALATVAALLLVAGTIVVGAVLSRLLHAVPPPFGPAKNGAIVFSVGDDLYLGELESVARRKVAGGVGFHPVISRDGTKIATTRVFKPGTRDASGVDACYQLGEQACDFEVVVTSVDGAQLAVLSGLPNEAFVVAWTPDGRSLLIRGRLGGSAALPRHAIDRYPIDGSAPSRVATGTDVWIGPGDAPMWRLEYDDVRDVEVLQAVDPAGNPAGLPIALPGMGSPEDLAISPDGSRIAVASIFTSPDGPPPGETEHPTGRLLIVRADGSVERSVEVGQGIQSVEFSPDGQSLAVGLTDFVDWTSAIVPADGTWTPFLLGDGASLLDCRWAPDGSMLMCSGSDGAFWLVDPRTGVPRRTRWSTETLPFGIEWQRLAA